MEDMEGERFDCQTQSNVLLALLLSEEGAEEVLRVERVDQLAGNIVPPDAQ
jgi:hypothetical protein